MNSSPQRGTFHIECQLQHVEDGTTTAEKAEEMIDFYKSWEQRRKEMEQTPEWQKDNMEYDLRSAKWICDKAKASNSYAQNLYAAICNNEFMKNEVWPVLQNKTWSASWRSAGGIIANMVEEGDYINWYCSGIRSNEDMDDGATKEMTEEGRKLYEEIQKYVSESVVTDEIKADLLKLGWIVVPSNE